MKKQILVAMAAVLSTGAFADTTTLTIAKPIVVNKTDLKGYSDEAVEALDVVSTRLSKTDGDVRSVSTEFDYASNGKIYTIYDFAKMPIERVVSILNDGNHCAVTSNIYTVKKEWSWSKFANVVSSITLQGVLKAENWYPNAANYGTYMSVQNGKGTIWQRLQREYSVYDQAGNKSYVYCMTTLKSTTVEEAEAKYNSYASDAFGPLKSALGL